MIAIVCADKNNGIGKDGKLLYHYKEDMEFFKHITKDKIVVMGRKTFQSLPNGALKGRKNIVITNTLPRYDMDNLFVGELDFVEKHIDNNAVIIGGEQIYKLFADKCNTIYITRVNDEPKEADTFFFNPMFYGYDFSGYVTHFDGHDVSNMTDKFNIERWDYHKGDKDYICYTSNDGDVINAYPIYTGINAGLYDVYTSPGYKHIDRCEYMLLADALSRFPRKINSIKPYLTNVPGRRQYDYTYEAALYSVDNPNINKLSIIVRGCADDGFVAAQKIAAILDIIDNNK